MILLRIRRFCTKCSMVGGAPSTYWVTIASFFQSGLQPASCLLGAVLLWVGGAGVHPAVAEVSAVRMVEPVGEGATDQWPQWRGPSRRSDGELLWETFVPYRTAPEQGWPKSSYASSTPATDGQRVYAYFELLHVNQLESHVFASPALLDKRWYIRTYKHLMCVGER